MQARLLDCHEVTERRMMADMVWQKELSLAQAQRVAHVGSYEWDTETGAIAWSDELCRIFGFEPGSTEMGFETFISAVHPDDRGFVADGLQRAVDAAEQFEAVFRIHRPDGSIRWIDGRGEVVRDLGKAPRLIGTGQDITERKSLEAERDRLKSEAEATGALFRGAFRASRAGMALIAPSGRYLEVNEAFCDMVGYSREELLKMDWISVTHPDDLAENLVRSRETWLGVGTEDVAYEKRLIRKDGSVALVELTDAIIRNDDGEPSYFITHVRDITEKRAMEARLAQSQKMDAIGQLTAGIAHDFNNLLSVIRNYTLFVMEDLEDQSLVEDLQQVTSAADGAARLVKQLLAFSRKEIVSPEVVDMNSLVASAAQMLTRTIGEHIDLNLRLSPGAGAALVDPGQLEQLLINLCVNARDAMSSGGTLTIETTNVDVSPSMAATRPGLEPNTYVVLSVSDTGHGIPDEVQERIFEPFFTTKERGAGTGLGLATAYGIVKQAGGFIDLESKVGQGAAFKVFLPVTSASTGSTEAPLRLPLGGGERVLVVEDDPSIRGLVARILQKSGYRALMAEDGNAALRMISQEDEIDVILTDVVMPKMSGMELAKAARSRGIRRILYMSGYPYSTLDKMGIEHRSQYVEKPLSEADLLSKLRRVLDAEPLP